MKTIALSAIALLSLLWPAEAGEMTNARRDAVRALGETAALLKICPRYDYDERKLIDLYVEARLPPSFLLSDADISQFYEQVQRETEALVDDLSKLVSIDRDKVACSLARQYAYDPKNERVDILRTKPDIEAAEEAERAKSMRAYAEEIRQEAAPVARALMLMRSCYAFVLDEAVFQRTYEARAGEVRLEAVKIANSGGVKNLPPEADRCAAVESEYGPQGTLVRNLARPN